jgi:D-3-phosphoglycerate dehydrogenase
MRNRKTVMVPVSFGRHGLAVFEERADIDVVLFEPSIKPADLHEKLREVSGIALSFTRFGQPELDAAPLMQVVARIGVGFDAVDVPALTRRRVPLMVVGEANARSVAEHAVAFIFALAKRVPDMDRRVHQGVAHDRKSGLPGEVAGKTLLIVGFGRIGTRTAPRCKALEMEVLVYDPYVPADAVRQAGYEPVADLDEALARADYVTIHCPKNAETIGMFDADRLARMKPGAFLVNTARGGIVDEAALADALTTGQIGGAALDVFDPEPPPASHPLLHMDMVIASPHMAGVTVESMAAMAVMTARNILGVFDGTPNRDNVIDLAALEPA